MPESDQIPSTPRERAQAAATNARNAADEAEKQRDAAEQATATVLGARTRAAIAADLQEAQRQQETARDKAQEAVNAAISARLQANLARMYAEQAASAQADATQDAALAKGAADQAAAVSGATDDAVAIKVRAAQDAANNLAEAQKKIAAAAQAQQELEAANAAKSEADEIAREKQEAVATAPAETIEAAKAAATDAANHVAEAANRVTEAQNSLNAAQAAKEQADKERPGLEKAALDTAQEAAEARAANAARLKAAQVFEQKDTEARHIAALAADAQASADRTAKAAATAEAQAQTADNPVASAQAAADKAARSAEEAYAFLAQEQARKAAQPDAKASVLYQWFPFLAGENPLDRARTDVDKKIAAAQDAATTAQNAAAYAARAIMQKAASQKLITDALNPPTQTGTATLPAGAGSAVGSAQTVVCKPEAKWGIGYTLALLTITVAICILAWWIPVWTLTYKWWDFGASTQWQGRYAAWLVTMTLMGLFIVIAGKGATGLWRGLFIDPRNRISLSRVQMALWTVVVLSAWITAVISNYSIGDTPPVVRPGDIIRLKGPGIGTDLDKRKITLDGRPLTSPSPSSVKGDMVQFALPAKNPVGADGKPADWQTGQTVLFGITQPGSQDVPAPVDNPKFFIVPSGNKNQNYLSVAIPQELWLALGISLTSLVGTPLILSNKKNTVPDLQIKQEGEDKAKNSGMSNPAAQGLLLGKGCPADSQFSDLFRGEEVGNGAYLDLAKVQMFFFTVALILAYVVALNDLFHELPHTAIIISLPTLSSGFVALLAISHAGYLTSKAITNTPTDGNTATTDSKKDSTPAKPAAPTGLKVDKAGNKQIDLSWTASLGATYNLYRATEAGKEGTAALKKDIKEPKVTDSDQIENDKTYFYQVTAVNSVGESDKSSEVQAKPQA